VVAHQFNVRAVISSGSLAVDFSTRPPLSLCVHIWLVYIGSD
jgi:hypothetical protein